MQGEPRSAVARLSRLVPWRALAILLPLLLVVGLFIGLAYAQSPPPPGAIAGQISKAEDGTPYSGAYIAAFTIPVSGRPLTTTGSGPGGGYVLRNLPPGQYILGAGADPERGAPDRRAMQFYPGTYDPGQAGVVNVTSGVTTTGINFLLERGYLIAGHVYAEEAPVQGVSVYARRGEQGFRAHEPTDEFGAYSLVVLSGTWQMGVDNAGSWVLLDVVTATVLTDCFGVDLNLVAGGTVSGTVYNATGSGPLADMVVFAESTDHGYRNGTMSGPDGKYVISGLPFGSYFVAAGGTPTLYRREYWQEVANWKDATVITLSQAVTGVTGISFTLEMGTILSGTLRDPLGAGVAGAQVMVYDRYHAFQEGSQSEGDGAFRIGGVPTGTYLMMAEPPDGSPWAASQERPVVVAALGITQSVGVITLTRPVLTGTVVAPDGITPVENARAEAHTQDWSIYKDGRTDASGIFRIGGLGPGKYTLEAQAPQQGPGSEYTDALPQTVTVIEGATTYAGVFTLTLPQIYGTVVAPDGNTPVAWAGVSLYSPDRTFERHTGADDHGQFQMGGVRPGGYLMEAYPPPNSNLAASSPISVPVGPQPVTVTLRLNRVSGRGRVLDPDGNPAPQSGVDLYTPDFSFHGGTGTDMDGSFAFGGVPTGTYFLEIHAPWGTSGWISPPPTTVTVTHGAVFTAELQFLRASKFVLGRVVRSNPGEGVADVEVHANRLGAPGWAHTTTAGDGGFNLGLSGGMWELMIHSRPGEAVNWVYSGEPRKVSFANDAVTETKTVTFTVYSSNANVIGTVRGPSGEMLNPWAVWVDVRNPQGQGNGTQLSGDGSFNLPVVAGGYQAWVHVDPQQYPTYSSPEIPPFSVASDQTHDLGEIRLVGKSSFIEGQVTRQSDGQGIPGVCVNAWKRQGAGWGNTTTSTDGSFSLSVVSGTWEVGIALPFTSTYVTGQPPRMVEVGDNQTITDVNFTLLEAAGTILGTVRDQDGNPLTQLSGWAYVRKVDEHQPTAGAPLDNGSFTVQVPTGTYRVGVHLPPGSSYVPAGEAELDISAAGLKTPAQVAERFRSRFEQELRVASGGTYPVTITLLATNAQIRGGFFQDISHTIAATGLEGEVFAMAGEGVWQGTSINPANGGYVLNVSPGTWNLGYHLRSEGFVNSPPPESRATISATQVFTMNFTVVEASSRITGTILRPDSSPLNFAWAWAHRERTETTARLDTGSESQPPEGRFSISLPAGTYHVGAHAPEELGYIQPEVQVITVSGVYSGVVLQFQESNATITGTVYYHDQAGNPVYGVMAWVWAWSEDGAHTGAPVRPNGTYLLNVVTGSIWHLGAHYQYDDSVFYNTITETVIAMTTTSAHADLKIFLNEARLPEAISVNFDASQPYALTLDDGTEINIPAGALAPSGTIRLVVTPMVEELANTLTARPFGFGYAIYAFDSDGRQLTSNFNSNALLTFYYTDDDLTRRGVSEDDLSPAYFSTTTNSWTKVESFTVDTAANRVTVQINHFSIWAMTVPQGAGVQTPTTYKVYAPLTVKNSAS